LNIDGRLVTKHRARRGWSQEELAREAGLDVRTIQRVETSGRASLRSVRALADALGLEVPDLEVANHELSPCPECRSEAVHRHAGTVDTSSIGGQLLPGLAPGRLSSARLDVVACADCGHVRFFLDDPARERMRSADTWPRV
jgi:transcriptional regulator with XRE-family HTH domain